MAAGGSPRESHPCIPHAALLIACDALNARTLTVREYQPACMSWPTSSRACMVIYMSDSTPYNEVEVMYSEQSS